MSALAFFDPVRDSQAVFRAILRAISSPGSVVPAGAGLAPPKGLSPAAAAAILTLVDFETPLWVSPTFPGYGEVAAYLRFHTGARFASVREKAAFALVDTETSALTLKDFGQGSAEYPDRSTTVILQVRALSGGAPLRIVGPGVNGTAELAPHPLPDDFCAQWRDNHATFPLGVDLILCAADRVAALPRSVVVTGEA